MNLIGAIFALGLVASPLIAQSLTLRGQVVDESGGIVPGAAVSLSGPGSLSETTKTGNDGSYTFTNLAPGSYAVRATAPGLALRQPARVELKSESQMLNLVLNVSL